MSAAPKAANRAGSEPEAQDPAYDPGRAGSYWGADRHERANELAAVLSLGEPAHVNAAYDAWETGLLEDGLAEALGPLLAARGLDLGAGVGRVALRLAPSLGRLACGDLAAGMLLRLRRNAARAGARNVDPVRLRSDRLPFRDASFQVAVCLGLLEHLPPAIREVTIEEVARVLKPGGVLALVLNNETSALLRDPADNPHRVGKQEENGYYCDLVRGADLLAKASLHFEARALGSNLFYALQRHAARRLPERDRGDARLAPFFDRAAAWDRALRPLGPLPRDAADHHLHLLVRR